MEPVYKMKPLPSTKIFLIFTIVLFLFAIQSVYGAVNDSDKDGFSDTVEQYLGTNPSVACGVDAWPPDFDNSRKVDIVDVGAIKLLMNTQAGDGKYNPRFDLNTDGKIDLIDVGATRPYFNKTCI